MSNTNTNEDTIEAVEPRELVLPRDAVVADVADRLIDQARNKGVALTGAGGLLTGLVQQVLQASLEAELTDHLGYEAHAVEGRGTGNSRNGFYPKTVRSEIGDIALEIPRDRNGTFRPATVRTGQRRLDGLDAQVISLYAKGLTTGDIAAHLFDCFDLTIDRSTISRITDAIVDDMQAW